MTFLNPLEAFPLPGADGCEDEGTRTRFRRSHLLCQSHLVFSPSPASSFERDLVDEDKLTFWSVAERGVVLRIYACFRRRCGYCLTRTALRESLVFLYTFGTSAETSKLWTCRLHFRSFGDRSYRLQDKIFCT